MGRLLSGVKQRAGGEIYRGVGYVGGGGNMKEMG